MILDTKDRHYKNLDHHMGMAYDLLLVGDWKRYKDYVYHDLPDGSLAIMHEERGEYLGIMGVRPDVLSDGESEYLVMADDPTYPIAQFDNFEDAIKWLNIFAGGE